MLSVVSVSIYITLLLSYDVYYYILYVCYTLVG